MNIIESFSGFKPTPTTFEPSRINQLHNQAPLKPVDPVTKTFRVEILADNNDEIIRDGETIEIRINLENNIAHLLPQSVLTLNDDGDIGVRTVIDNKVKFFEVDILRDQENGLLVTGLPKKIDVITVGQEFVLNGQNVNVSYE